MGEHTADKELIYGTRFDVCVHAELKIYCVDQCRYHDMITSFRRIRMNPSSKVKD